jgi:hypothetical protein
LKLTEESKQVSIGAHTKNVRFRADAQ